MRLDGRAWLVFALVGAVVAIAAQMASAWALHAAAKPATTIAIWGWARTRQGDSVARRRWIETGLALSLAGDVALMWPQGFVPGLVAFLLAHLAYIVAFSRGVGFMRHKLPFVAYAAIAAAVLSVLWPHIGAGLKAPVLAYVICLACMAAQALADIAAHFGAGVIQADGTLDRAALRRLVFDDPEERLDHAERQPAGELRRDEARHVRRGDAGERVGADRVAADLLGHLAGARVRAAAGRGGRRADRTRR